MFLYDMFYWLNLTMRLCFFTQFVCCTGEWIIRCIVCAFFGAIEMVAISPRIFNHTFVEVLLNRNCGRFLMMMRISTTATAKSL